MWLSAVLLNAVGVVGFVVGHGAAFELSALPVPGVFYDVWIAFVAIFMIAYWLIYRDPQGTRTSGRAWPSAPSVGRVHPRWEKLESSILSCLS